MLSPEFAPKPYAESRVPVEGRYMNLGELGNARVRVYGGGRVDFLEPGVRDAVMLGLSGGRVYEVVASDEEMRRGNLRHDIPITKEMLIEEMEHALGIRGEVAIAMAEDIQVSERLSSVILWDQGQLNGYLSLPKGPSTPTTSYTLRLARPD